MFDSVIAAITGVADNLVAALLSFIAMLSLALGASMLIFSLFYADILIGIGLALGPFVLALSVFSHFRNALSSWTSFMFGAMATKIVVVIIATTMTDAMSQIQLTGIQASTAGAAFANTGAMIGIIFLGFILTAVAKDADKIATGLFGGISTSRAPTGSDYMKTLNYKPGGKPDPKPDPKPSPPGGGSGTPTPPGRIAG